MVEEGLLKESADAIADFLYKEGDMLSMVSVGEYLGENHELNITVLKKLVGLHKLEGLSLVDALRYLCIECERVSVLVVVGSF